MQKKEIPITQRGDLTEAQWERIEPYLPCHGNGHPFRNIRATLNGILWILRTGAPGEISLRCMENGIPFINALLNGKRQVFLKPCFKF